MTVVEIDEKGHNERPPNYQKERQENLEKVSAYIAESIKKQSEKSTKNSLIDDLSKGLLK